MQVCMVCHRTHCNRSDCRLTSRYGTCETCEKKNVRLFDCVDIDLFAPFRKQPAIVLLVILIISFIVLVFSAVSP